MMEYKGYTGAVEVDEDAGLIFGEVRGLRDIVTFRGRTVEEARRCFRESVDFYIESCRREGKEPEQPFSGQFHVRISPDLHRKLVDRAEYQGCSLNDVVAEALAAAVGEAPALAKVPPPTCQEVKAAILARRGRGRRKKADAARQHPIPSSRPGHSG